MKMIRISDELAERLDNVSGTEARRMGVRSLSREQVAGILLDEVLKTRKGKAVVEKKAAEG